MGDQLLGNVEELGADGLEAMRVDDRHELELR